MHLNKGQAECVELGVYWERHQTKQTFEVSGPPGTGKSTVAATLTKAIGWKKVLYVAFTGAAVANLRRKGLDAVTIHSVIYDYEKGFLRVNGDLVMRSGYPVTTILPILKKQLDEDWDGIVVDEAYMVTEHLANDLKSFGLRMICLGDHDQVDPVGGNPGFFQNGIDYRLTEYMRQALHSGIIRVSKYVNEGGIIKPGMDFGPDVEIIKKKLILPRTLKLASINITSSNKMRRRINDVYREHMGYKEDQVYMNEALICKRNSWKNVLHDGQPLVNGTLGYMKHYPNIAESDLKANQLKIDFQPNSSDDYFYNIPIDMKHLLTGGIETDKYNHSLLKFEFGYAITTHLSQGNEYPSVLYIDDPIMDDRYMRKNRFTAFTRAEDILGIAI